MLKVISRRNFTPLCGLVLFLSVFSVFVGIGGSVYADTSMNYNINIKPALKLSVSSGTVSLLLNPTTQNFAAQNLNVTVGTNNYYGYQLFMNTASNTTNLVRQNNSAVDGASFSTPPTIPTLASSTTASAFPANYWGYRINNNVGGNADYIDTTASNANSGNYFGYTSGTLISSSATTTNEKTASLTFGAKADFNKPAGTYKLDLNFEAVPIVRTYYMQELAENVPLSDMLCTSEPITVLDQRDEKAYSITRLPDGNCWMTTNLDLAGGTTLTPADSNVSADYTLPASETISSGTTLTNSSAFSDDDIAYVFNSNSTTCGADSPCYSYYNYAAATAGTNPYSGEATSDICPKGWKLPTNAEYTTLINTYPAGATFATAPFNGAPAGGFWRGSFYIGNPPSGGVYLTSTIWDYFAFRSSGTADVGEDPHPSWGYGVRCVLKKPTMQGFTSTDAANMATGGTKTLTDTRDGKDYTIAKLPDGNVWMTKNLDLAGGTTITPADSNVSANYTLPASDNSSTSFANESTAYVYNSNSTTCSDSSPCYSYYSFAAATAGTDPSSGDAASDICPKGWRLPTKDEYTTLSHIYTTGATLTAAPFRALYGGAYKNSVLEYGGTNGFYWASTSASSVNAYRIAFYSSYADVGDLGKRWGLNVRCVAKKTMQNFTSADAASMAMGDAKTLTDARDGKNYSIAKLPDGKVWMTKNLDLPGGTTITKTDSNITATAYMLPDSANTNASFSNNTDPFVYNTNNTECTSTSPCYSYYSYVAATAGTNPSSGNATSDICPKGWRLPTKAEFTVLSNTYTTATAITAAPFNAVKAGAIAHMQDDNGNNMGPFEYGGVGGRYWSSTADISYAAQGLFFKNNNYGDTNTISGWSKGWGFSIRCVAK